MILKPGWLRGGHLTEPTFHYSVLVKRAIAGFILGAIAGAIQVWFFNHDLMHLWASIASGIVYMTTWVSCTDWLKLAGGKILLGAVAGVLAAIVWWAIASPVEDAFIQSIVAGLCFGAAFAWSESRKAL